MDEIIKNRMILRVFCVVRVPLKWLFRKKYTLMYYTLMYILYICLIY